MTFYSKNAGDVLKDRLKEIASRGPDKRLAIVDEIDMMRLCAERSVQLFEAAHYGPDAEKTSESLKMQTTEMVKESMSSVAQMVEKAMKIRTMSDATINVTAIDYIIHQVNTIIEREIADHDREMCDRVLKALSDIVLPDEHNNRPVVVIS